MIARLRRHAEKLALGAALGCVLGGTTWAWNRQTVIDALRREAGPVTLATAPYPRAVWPAATLPPRAWSQSALPSGGAGWTYELFTPPIIYYHAATRSFTVKPPGAMSETTTAFGLELLDVKRELYRLQLVGYVGAPGNYVAAFVSPELPETLLARTGRRFDELGLSLADFAVRKVNVSGDPAMPAYEFAAIATLRDERTGGDVTLDSRARKFTDAPLALLRLGAEPKPREVREGDVIEEESATYRIERIQLDPPEVVVAKQIVGLPFPETRVLTPVATEKVAKKAPTPARRFAPKKESGVAVSERRP